MRAHICIFPAADTNNTHRAGKGKGSARSAPTSHPGANSCNDDALDVQQRTRQCPSRAQRANPGPESGPSPNAMGGARPLRQVTADMRLSSSPSNNNSNSCGDQLITNRRTLDLGLIFSHAFLPITLQLLPDRPVY